LASLRSVCRLLPLLRNPAGIEQEFGDAGVEMAKRLQSVVVSIDNRFVQDARHRQRFHQLSAVLKQDSLCDDNKASHQSRSCEVAFFKCAKTFVPRYQQE